MHWKDRDPTPVPKGLRHRKWGSLVVERHQNHAGVDLCDRGRIYLHHRIPMLPCQFVVGPVDHRCEMLERQHCFRCRSCLEYRIGRDLDDTTHSCPVEIADDQEEACWRCLHASYCITVSIPYRSREAYILTQPSGIIASLVRIKFLTAGSAAFDTSCKSYKSTRNLTSNVWV